MKTSALFFPFDLFGSGGTRAGVELLADAFQEMLADNKRERQPTRARAYTNKVRFQEFTFDKLAEYETWRTTARAAVREAWARGDFLLWITGNHLGALPVYEEFATKSDPTPLVLQFDGHLDIYNLSDCTPELSHGNFLLHAEGALPAIVNVGHRELLLKPEYIEKHFSQTWSAADVALGADHVAEQVGAIAQAAPRVLIDLDCDVFEPAYFPAAAHPLPFGISPQLFLRFLAAAWSERVAGLCISEFDPAQDRRDQSLSTLVWLIEHVLLLIHEKR